MLLSIYQMKKIITITLSLFAINSFADPQAETDGTLSVECTAATHSGKILTVSTCVKARNEGIDGNDQAEIVPCSGDSFEWVTITRKTSVAKQTPDMVETVKVPGRLFDVGYGDGEFSLRLDDQLAGKLNLVEYSENSSVNFLNLDLPSMNHSFKALGCSFTL